ncbi:hypothetical protein FS837_002957 [Tulasnella sp. UAMH 9824]|nr:hypothetical protein FS837_002957 [Tulasnella sp. UAMH 9824]
MSSTQQDNHYDADSNRSPESEQGGVAGRFHPSVKLMEKMEKLAKWRIDPSLIEFPNDTVELHGGHATVSRAMLNASSNKSGTTGEFGARNGAGQKPSMAVDTKFLQLTLREAGFLVELSHENIVGLEGYVEDVSEGILWLVFPWEVNGNLRAFIASQDWEIPERIWLIDDVTKGVEYLHSQNPPICHGDLKSANVLVNSNCRAVITDFGSARRLVEANLDAETGEVGNQRQPAARLEATFSASTNTITLTGNEFTLRWAAPELLNDEPPTVKVDIWALGWIAYEPMVAPDPTRTTSATLAEARSPLLLIHLGDMHKQQDDYVNASKFYMEALGIYTGTADRRWRAAVLDRLAGIHRLQGQPEEAIALYSEALETFKSCDERTMKAQTLCGLAQTYQIQYKYSQAATFLSDALEIYIDINDTQGKADALLGLAEVHRLQKEYNDATTCYSDALQIFTDSGDRQGRASALWGLGEVHRLQTEYNQATTLFSDALQIYIDIGHIRGRAFVLLGLAGVKNDQGHYKDAFDLYEQAAKLFEHTGSSDMRSFALEAAAGVVAN